MHTFIKLKHETEIPNEMKLFKLDCCRESFGL